MPDNACTDSHVCGGINGATEHAARRICYTLQVYLIEVNTSPALYRHGQVLTDLLPILIEEVVQKVRTTPDCKEASRCC